QELLSPARSIGLRIGAAYSFSFSRNQKGSFPGAEAAVQSSLLSIPSSLNTAPMPFQWNRPKSPLSPKAYLIVQHQGMKEQVLHLRNSICFLHRHSVLGEGAGLVTANVGYGSQGLY